MITVKINSTVANDAYLILINEYDLVYDNDFIVESYMGKSHIVFGFKDEHIDAAAHIKLVYG